MNMPEVEDCCGSFSVISHGGQCRVTKKFYNARIRREEKFWDTALRLQEAVAILQGELALRDPLRRPDGDVVVVDPSEAVPGAAPEPPLSECDLPKEAVAHTDGYESPTPEAPRIMIRVSPRASLDSKYVVVPVLDEEEASPCDASFQVPLEAEAGLEEKQAASQDSLSEPMEQVTSGVEALVLQEPGDDEEFELKPLEKPIHTVSEFCEAPKQAQVPEEPAPTDAVVEEPPSPEVTPKEATEQKDVDLKDPEEPEPSDAEKDRKDAAKPKLPDADKVADRVAGLALDLGYEDGVLRHSAQVELTKRKKNAPREKKKEENPETENLKTPKKSKQTSKEKQPATKNQPKARAKKPEKKMPEKKGKKSPKKTEKKTPKKKGQSPKKTDTQTSPKKTDTQTPQPEQTEKKGSKRKSDQLVSDAERAQLKKTHGLNGHLLLRVFLFSFCFGFAPVLPSPRLMVQNSDYSLVPYWTRLQVGVKHKKTKKQVWTTTVGMTLCFKAKILLANDVVPCPSEKLCEAASCSEAAYLFEGGDLDGLDGYVSQRESELLSLPCECPLINGP